VRNDNDMQDSDEDLGPTRTQQRRDALAVLAFAIQLCELPPSRVAKMNLPDDVLTEIGHVRRITAHGARKRQLAYLAKIMRRHDDSDFDDARAAMGENRERQRQETAAMHRLENQRDKLLADDDALGAFIAGNPGVDRQHLRSLIRQARTEREANKPMRAYREIFQILKDLAGGGDADGDTEADASGATESREKASDAE
jgi:ribosome-associated protein